jgi:hypothetical protein
MRLVGVVVAVAVVAAVGGCHQTSDGHAVASQTDATSVEASSPRTSPRTSPSTSPPTSTTDPDYPTMGVTPTVREVVPPNALVCLPTPTPGTPATAQIGDGSAPKIVIALPEGWAAAPAPAGLSLTGPGGMSGAVEIRGTTLDAAAAFEKYSDDVSALAPISSVSVLPAENCGYSGQRLMGVLSGGAQGKQTYEDRIVHVWTNTGDYLVVIHVAAPQGSPAFEAATSTLTADFAITVP